MNKTKSFWKIREDVLKKLKKEKFSIKTYPIVNYIINLTIQKCQENEKKQIKKLLNEVRKLASIKYDELVKLVKEIFEFEEEMLWTSIK